MKFKHRIRLLTLMTTIGLGLNPAMAQTSSSNVSLVVDRNADTGGYEIRSINLDTGAQTVLQTLEFNSRTYNFGAGDIELTEAVGDDGSYVDHMGGKLYIPISLLPPAPGESPPTYSEFFVYDIKTNTYSRQQLPLTEAQLFPNIQVGGVNGMISYAADGSLHIGENSLVTTEEDGRQKLFATNAANDPIDIDVTNGSDLLVNGVSVMDSIAAEETARLAADNALSNRVDAIGSRVDSLEGRVDGLDDKISSSTATAIALGGMGFLPDMKFNLATNVATYRGAHAVSAQFGYRATRHVAITGGVAGGVNKGGKVGGRVGFIFGW